MKICIVWCLLMVSVEMKLRPEVIIAWENYHIPHFDECVQEAGVDPMIPRLMFREINFPDEEDFHCYLRCIFKHNGWLTEDEDDIDSVAILQALHVKPDLLQFCGELVASEPEICRKAYLTVKCAVDDQLSSMRR
ncbi:uncharacterized protein LOC116172604 [Photinus pyralis]|uniref:uncharacterized protein LOC116172604 n=1 Tax=Photinus pyralis TaxID=7054 RepID=UPI0012671510|nr:uncharacterized protein LOC116172604 [Photinus pyralis]